MSRYLDMLKGTKSKTGLPNDPPKLPELPEQGLGGFGGRLGDHILKNAPVPEAATIEPATESGEGLGGFGGSPGSGFLKNESQAADETGDAANDAQAGQDQCAGALIDPDGGAYLPWGPYLSPADVQRMRGELFDMIDELCRREGWTDERRHDTMTRAVRGPLSDLMPNLAYFNGQLTVVRAEAAARAAMEARTWRMEGFDNRRGE
jgi:hypothetical protein